MFRGSSVPSDPSLPAQRAADTERRFLAPAATRRPATLARKAMTFTKANACLPSNRRDPAPAARNTAAPLPPTDQTGRRSMRQTVMPTGVLFRTSATTAKRRESFPRRSLLGLNSAWCPGRRFGLPLTPESGGPSCLPAARFALAATRAVRRQEPSHAQQNVDRCHPPGRDPGRRGAWQSR